jgi:hypothetical protein
LSWAMAAVIDRFRIRSEQDKDFDVGYRMISPQVAV